MILKEKYHALTENFRRLLNEYFMDCDFDTSEFLELIDKDHVMEECICGCHASCFVYTVFHDGFLSLSIEDIVKAIKLSIISMQIGCYFFNARCYSTDVVLRQFTEKVFE